MVIEAPDGEAALEFGAETVKKARLLVTDMVMPKMGGIELAARVRETAPDLPVIYVSGYSEALVAARVKTGENSLFLQNPVDPAKLLLMVREALDKLKK
jgi:CheY-like chemotaxis protein